MKVCDVRGAAVLGVLLFVMLSGVATADEGKHTDCYACGLNIGNLTATLKQIEEKNFGDVDEILIKPELPKGINPVLLSDVPVEYKYDDSTGINGEYAFKVPPGQWSIYADSISVSEVYPAGFLSGIKVAYADIHGERQSTSLDAMKNLLRKLGATVTTITSVSQLSNYNILWIDEWGTDYTRSEITTILNWLAEGNKSNPRGIIFHGDQVGAINLMNAVGAFYTGQPAHAGVSTNIRPPVNTVVQSVDFPAPLNSIEDMAWIAKDINNDHTMVGVNTIKGRVALIADDILWYSTSEPNLASEDNAKLGVLIFGWLGWKIG